MTRRAFSVYRSNTISSLLPRGFPPQRFSRYGFAERHAQVPRFGRTVRPAPNCASRSATSGGGSDVAVATTQTQSKHFVRLDLRSVHPPVVPVVLLPRPARSLPAAVPRPKVLLRGVRPDPASLLLLATFALPRTLLPVARRALVAASLHFLLP